MDNNSNEVIPSRLAITAMRDSGYRNTAYAISELIDNAQQAEASEIDVVCLEVNRVISERRRSRISEIAVIDNGKGMDAEVLRSALQFGNGTRLNDRSGIGRFGMGLPNSSISQAGRVDVWSWRNGPDNAMYTYISVPEVETGAMREVPQPEHQPVPDKWRERASEMSHSGTLVVWSEIDPARLTWKTSKATLQNTEKLVGRIYRHFLNRNALSIRLRSENVDEGEVVYDEFAQVNDPLYLMSSPLVPAPFTNTAMFEHVDDVPYVIDYDGVEHEVLIRFSVARPETVKEAGTSDRGKTKYGQHARGNIGVSLVRAEREIALDHGWCIGYDPRERWWGAEVMFSPSLDELFGVTNNKQAAVHFSELAGLDWEELALEGEEFRDVVLRLKDDGDPRGWLLELSDGIKRNLQELRDTVKSQASGGRSTRKQRHDEVDDVTTSVNEKWKDRSKERPITGEEVESSEQEYETIQEDLVDKKSYSPEEAEDIINVIKENDLKVIFLEADFPDRYQLFGVETKGPVTEVTFNRRHPGFDDVFGTINTVDEDINDLTKEEVLNRLARAINASKVIFAAWARYEREAGVDRARALEKVRVDWGHLAAQFLSDESDPLL